MQIMKRHSRALFGASGSLTRGQRYHFIAGWLPWFADALGLVFSVLALVWSALVIAAPRQFDVPLTAFSMVVITLFAVKTLKTLVLHRVRIGAGRLAVGGAALAGLSLAFVVAKAVILGILTSNTPFVRTPKCEPGAPWTATLGMVRVELSMLVLMVLALVGLGMVTAFDDPAEIFFGLALTVMAVPFAAAVTVALGSTRGVRPAPGFVPEVLSPPELPVAPRNDLDLAA